MASQTQQSSGSKHSLHAEYERDATRSVMACHESQQQAASIDGAQLEASAAQFPKLQQNAVAFLAVLLAWQHRRLTRETGVYTTTVAPPFSRSVARPRGHRAKKLWCILYFNSVLTKWGLLQIHDSLQRAVFILRKGLFETVKVQILSFKVRILAFKVQTLSPVP